MSKVPLYSCTILGEGLLFPRRDYRDTSLIRNRPPPEGHCRAQAWSYCRVLEVAVPYERGSPVFINPVEYLFPRRANQPFRGGPVTDEARLQGYLAHK